VPVSPDITAYGTDRLALIGSGIVKDLCDPASGPKLQKVITPRNDLPHPKAVLLTPSPAPEFGASRIGNLVRQCESIPFMRLEVDISNKFV